MIVVDASVLTDYLLRRTPAIGAVDRAVEERETSFHAPQVVDLEILNALRGMARADVIDDARASEAAAALSDVALLRYPHELLRLRVWALRHELSAYDAAYLALAEALRADLITADRGLAQRARAAIGAERVQLVE